METSCVRLDLSRTVYVVDLAAGGLDDAVDAVVGLLRARQDAGDLAENYLAVARAEGGGGIFVRRHGLSAAEMEEALREARELGREGRRAQAAARYEAAPPFARLA